MYELLKEIYEILKETYGCMKTFRKSMPFPSILYEIYEIQRKQDEEAKRENDKTTKRLNYNTKKAKNRGNDNIDDNETTTG